MILGKTSIQAKTGLHARPAAELVALTKSFQSKILIRSGAKAANGASIINLLALGLKSGSEIEIIAEGEDETTALQAVLDFFENLKD
jgi:phosphotransferase system HPr (HPr) family protein